jgi:hypothetical protein
MDARLRADARVEERRAVRPEHGPRCSERCASNSRSTRPFERCASNSRSTRPSERCASNLPSTRRSERCASNLPSKRIGHTTRVLGRCAVHGDRRQETGPRIAQVPGERVEARVESGIGFADVPPRVRSQRHEHADEDDCELGDEAAHAGSAFTGQAHLRLEAEKQLPRPDRPSYRSQAGYGGEADTGQRHRNAIPAGSPNHEHRSA